MKLVLGFSLEINFVMHSFASQWLSLAGLEQWTRRFCRAQPDEAVKLWAVVVEEISFIPLNFLQVRPNLLSCSSRSVNFAQLMLLPPSARSSLLSPGLASEAEILSTLLHPAYRTSSTWHAAGRLQYASPPDHPRLPRRTSSPSSLSSSFTSASKPPSCAGGNW